MIRRPSIGFLVPINALALFALAGCAAQSDGASPVSSTTESATVAASASDGGAVDPTACLTAFVGCVRDGTDDDTCKDALRDCARPPRPAGDGDGDHACGDGGRPPRPGSSGDTPPPPPPPGSSGQAPPPPPPPHDDDADGGPRACIDALDTCAHGSDAVDVCVTAAIACLASFPPPPPPPPRH